MTDSQTTGLEYVACSLCGADSTELLYPIPVPAHHRGDYSRDVFDLVRCRRCRLVYLNPRLDVETLNRIYEFEAPEDRKFVEDWFIESADLQRPTWDRFLRVLRAFKPEGRLLDIGCGAGSFLVRARLAGFSVSGQEISPYFASYCRDHQDLNVLEGEIADLDLSPGTFDVVTAFDVIEHHPDPNLLLSHARALLKPGGVLMMSTHDIGNFYARLYGPKWRHINPVGHITYFTRGTLRKMMEKHGFRVLKVGGIHTIEPGVPAEMAGRVVQFIRVVLLRSLILGVYRPLAARFPPLRRWSFRYRGAFLDHDKLMVRAGTQVIMDDDMVFIAAAGGDPLSKSARIGCKTLPC